MSLLLGQIAQEFMIGAAKQGVDSFFCCLGNTA